MLNLIPCLRKTVEVVLFYKLVPAEYGLIVTIHKRDRIYSKKGTAERKCCQLF